MIRGPQGERIVPIEKVHGRLEVIGPHKTWGVAKREESGSEMYSYLRIDAPDGKVTMLEHVLARRQIAAFMRPGAQGDFYLFETRGKEEVSRALFAFKDDKKFVADAEVGDYLIKSMKRLERKRLILAGYQIFLGISLLIFVIGLPLLGLGLYNLNILFKLRSQRLQVPSTADIQIHLKEAGLQAV